MLIDGKKVASETLQKIKDEMVGLKRAPGLAIIVIGDNPASQTYVRSKERRCQELGFYSEVKRFSSDVTEAAILHEIKSLNKDSRIDGILVQLPIPNHISKTKVLESIDPKKDVDGFHPINMGRLLLGEEGLCPCTPLGIIKLLEYYEIDVTGKHVVILGRSNIVGKPLAALLLKNSAYGNATVTVAHSLSHNVKELTLSADVIVAAVGKPNLITADMVKKGSVVIDVGINHIDSKLVGDVDFKNVEPLCSYITPVPGGVGPMTVAALLFNTFKSFKQR